MPPVNDIIMGAAIAGVCLMILGARRVGGWLVCPAAVTFVAWPVFRLFAPFLPLWVFLVTALITPVFLLLFTIRGGMEITRFWYGQDVASRTTTKILAALGRWVFGGAGRARDRRAPEPILPRPGTNTFNPQTFGGRHGADDA